MLYANSLNYFVLGVEQYIVPHADSNCRWALGSGSVTDSSAEYNPDNPEKPIEHD
jgi:hypothetical protein